MAITDNDPRFANAVKLVEPLRLTKSYKASVNASASIASIIGEALPAKAAAVTVVNESGSVTLRVQVGAASASSGGILPGASFTLYGNKTQLDAIRFYTGSASDISFYVYSTLSGE